MGKFRKKPVEIEAIQFTGEVDQRENLERWIHGAGCQTSNWFFDGELYGSFLIRSRQGLMQAQRGDWIINGVEGEFYPRKPDIFEQNYEMVSDG